jgi:hypothetical protein
MFEPSLYLTGLIEHHPQGRVAVTVVIFQTPTGHKARFFVELHGGVIVGADFQKNLPRAETAQVFDHMRQEPWTDLSAAHCGING